MTPRESKLLQSWFGLLGISRTSLDFHFLLWCVSFARGMRFIHKFFNRSVRCTLRCVGCYLCVCFLLLRSRIFLNKT